MKKTIVLYLAIVAGWLGCVSTGLHATEPTAKEPEIPGSAVMPPSVKEAALPPKPQKSGQVRLGVWIREDGSVEDVEIINGMKSWDDACVAAAEKMKFEPVMWEGRPIPARTELQYAFDSGWGIRTTFNPLPNLPGELHSAEEWGLTKALIEVDPDTILPLVMRSRSMLTIETALNYVIMEDGSTDKIELLGASSEGAVRSALDLVSERKYKPAKLREQPVRMKFSQVLSFRSMGMSEEALGGAEDIVDPAYPYERLLAGDEGHATVKFTLSGTGTVESAVLVDASHPDFGASLVAAVESWRFKTDAAADKAVREYRHEFQLTGVPYSARRLIRVVREGSTISNSRKGLDATPKVLARPGLAYPTALFGEGTAGEAVVECVIDRVGLAQIPRVVSASRPEFGWAAVTLVNGMRFTPVTRSGKAAELRVQLPIKFTPPTPAAPAADG